LTAADGSVHLTAVAVADEGSRFFVFLITSLIVAISSYPKSSSLLK